MIRILPVGLDESLTDARTITAAHINTKNKSHLDFNISVAATSDNAQQLGQVVSEVGSLFIPFNHLSGNINKVAAVASHFNIWPPVKPIVTDAKTTDLASILLLASLHSRPVHIHNVIHRHDIALIALSKEKGLQVTCDVSVYALFLSRADYPDDIHLPTLKDQKALWDHMDIIDCFSIGSLPYYVAHSAKQNPSPIVGIADTLPLLLSAVADGRLTLDDIIQRLHDNPIRIFDLHEQQDSSVEVELDRRFRVPSGHVWSAFAGKTLTGVVRRVIFNGQTVYLDGIITSLRGQGKDMSGMGPIPRPSTRDSTSSASMIGPRRRMTVEHQLQSPFLRSADPSNSTYATAVHNATPWRIDEYTPDHTWSFPCRDDFAYSFLSQTHYLSQTIRSKRFASVIQHRPRNANRCRATGSFEYSPRTSDLYHVFRTFHTNLVVIRSCYATSRR